MQRHVYHFILFKFIYVTYLIKTQDGRNEQQLHLFKQVLNTRFPN